MSSYMACVHQTQHLHEWHIAGKVQCELDKTYWHILKMLLFVLGFIICTIAILSRITIHIAHVAFLHQDLLFYLVNRRKKHCHFGLHSTAV